MTTELKLSVSLQTAGTMRLTIDGREAALSSRKSLAILTYLALQPGRSESRERVAALLWSDSGGEHGRAALRQTLRRLKSDLGPAEDLIDADRSTLRLTQPVAVDILEAIAAAGSGAAAARCSPARRSISGGSSSTWSTSTRTSTSGSRCSASG